MGWKHLLLHSLIGILSSAALSADFSLSKSEYENFPNSLKGRHFFTLQRSSMKRDLVSSNKDLLDCRAQIAKAVCLVEPAAKGQAPEARPCLDGGSAYADPVEDLYDHYPPALQKMFCSVKFIFIEKDFFGTAYAGQIKDSDGKINGAMIGIRKSLLDQPPDLATWATWKEQLSFGGVYDSYTLTPDLPQVLTQSQIQTNDFLYFVITHEFGHLLDFANDVNKTKSCAEAENSQDHGECEMDEQGWGAFSWITDRKPKLENEFPHRSELCFYWCEGKPLLKNDVPQVYADMDQTSFISIYATTQPWDDFADSVAYFTMSKNLKLNYLISTKQGKTYDIVARLKSPRFSKKYAYLEKFLQRADLIYP